MKIKGAGRKAMMLDQDQLRVSVQRRERVRNIYTGICNVVFDVSNFVTEELVGVGPFRY